MYNSTFVYNGNTYPYFYHTIYDADPTYASERAVEIAIGLSFLSKCQGRVLEVGNVLPNYVKLEHDVLDLYDSFGGESIHRTNMIHEDILKFSPAKKYDLIISISTLEHVNKGFGTLDAVNNIKYHCLNKNGFLFITWRLGFMLLADALIFDLGLSRTTFMEKIDYRSNLFKQVSWGEVSKEFDTTIQSNGLLPRMPNGLFLGEFVNA